MSWYLSWAFVLGESWCAMVASRPGESVQSVDGDSELVERLEDLCVGVLAEAGQVPLKERVSMVRAITAALEVTRGKVTQVVHRHEAFPDVVPVGSGVDPDQR